MCLLFGWAWVGAAHDVTLPTLMTSLFPHTNTQNNVLVAQLWMRPISGGAVALVLFNRGETARTITASFAEVGLDDSKTASVEDVWSGAVANGVAHKFVASEVAPHGVVFITLTPNV